MVLPLETPMLLAGGNGPLPSGIDAVNSAECTFSEPVAKVTLELLRDVDVVHSQRVAVEPADANVGFPMPECGMRPGDHPRFRLCLRRYSESMCQLWPPEYQVAG